MCPGSLTALWCNVTDGIVQVFNCLHYAILDLRRSFDDVHIKTHTAYIGGLLRCSGALLQSLGVRHCSLRSLVLLNSPFLQFPYIALSSRGIVLAPCLPRRSAGRGRRHCSRIHMDQIRPTGSKCSCGLFMRNRSSSCSPRSTPSSSPLLLPWYFSAYTSQCLSVVFI